MSRKKYIVKSIDLDSVSNQFISGIADNLSNDDFDKTFMSFVIDYDKWIKENGFIIWRKLVDKIKIDNFNIASIQLFSALYKSLSAKLYWMHKYYRLKYDTSKTQRDKKNILDEFSSNVKSNPLIYNDLDLLIEVLRFEIPTDLKGNSKSRLSMDKYKFLWAITGVEVIYTKLQSVLEKVTTQMLIKYYQQEKLFRDKKIIDFGPKFYNDYKNRNLKDWKNIFDLYTIDNGFNEMLSELMENFYYFIEKKHPNSIIKNPTSNIPIFLFSQAAGIDTNKTKSKKATKKN